MLVCRNCRNSFSSDDLVSKGEYRGEFWGAPAYGGYSVCPYCGSDDYTDAVRCDLCDQWVPEDEISISEEDYYFCDYCVNEEAKKYMKVPEKNLDDVERSVLNLYKERHNG